MTDEINASTPSLNLAVERSLGHFVNQQGSQKLYPLLECVELLRQYTIVNFGEEYTINLINTELNKVKFSKTKNYEKLDLFLNKIRKKINQTQLLYEIMKTSKDSKEKIKYSNQISRIVSPFQKELYFVWMILLKISGVQNKTIGREFLRNPEESKYKRDSFERKNYREESKEKTGQI